MFELLNKTSERIVEDNSDVTLHKYKTQTILSTEMKTINLITVVKTTANAIKNSQGVLRS